MARRAVGPTVFLGVVLITLGLLVFGFLATPAIAEDGPPAALTEWRPDAVLAGPWTMISAKDATLDLVTRTCPGVRREWTRPDGVRLSMEWVQCRAPAVMAQPSENG